MKIILTHEHTDFDAIAAMLGAWKLNSDALPIVPRRPNRNVRDFLTLYWDELPYVRLEDLPRRRIEHVTVVDTQTFSPVKGMSASTEIQIIDHHPLDEAPDPRVKLYLDEVGATTTILTEQISTASISLSPVEATLLLLGIYEDTGKLSFGATSPRDLRAAAWLLDQGASLSVVNDFLQYPITDEQWDLYHQLVQKAEPYQFAGHTVIVAGAAAGTQVEEVSILAHKLRDLFDPDALFLLVKMNDHIQLVARSSTDAIDVSAIAGHFSGGGQRRAAAALIRGMTLREVEDRLHDLLETHVRPTTSVGEIMSLGVHTLDSTATVAEAAAMMSRLGHEGFPVVEEGHVVGILTRRECDRAMQLRLGDAPVSLYMKPGEIQVKRSDSVEHLQSIMMEHGVGQVPVVDGGELIGIVTRTDLITLWSTPERRPQQAVQLADQLAVALPPRLGEILRLTGRLADEMGFSSYVVGGFVRDILLGTPNLDLDLVVEGSAIKLARRLAREIGGRVRTHSRFGTAKWLPDENDDDRSGLGTLDFATARTEFYEHPTALPQVERSSIRQDLHRRDFTINTLALCLNGDRYGEMLDFYGGEADLKRGLIRVLHSLSFVEDPTRMLRAARLEQRLGFRIEARTEELLRGALDLLSRTTSERIRHELYLILAEDAPEKALRRLDELGVMARIESTLALDEWFLSRARSLRQAVRQGSILAGDDAAAGNGLPLPADGVIDLPASYLALLTCRLAPERLNALLERLRIMRDDATLARQLNRLWQTREQLATDRLRNSQVYALLHDYGEPALFLFYVASDSWLVRKRIELYTRRLKQVAPLVDGHALKALGVAPGPVYRQIIEQLRTAWLDEEITDAAGEARLLEKLLDEGRDVSSAGR